MFGVKDKVGRPSGTNRKKSLTGGGNAMPKRPSVALWPSLRSSSRGAILIMLACFLPVILVGIKYSEKLFQSKEQNIIRPEDTKVVKVCAQEAAFEVARNWNPGLTLAQQQDAVYKVADAVYNAHPCHYNSVLGRALPGVMAYDDDGNPISSDPSCKQVVYNTATKRRRMYYMEKWLQGYWYGNYAMWLGIDKITDPAKRVSGFDEVQQDDGKFSLVYQDLFIEPHMLTNVSDNCTAIVFCTPESSASGVGNYFFGDTLINSGYTASINNKGKWGNKFKGEGAADLPDETQTIRVAPTSNDLVVKVEVANDKIKATTDEDVGYAVPAECNVDIVLAVPTNGAACNVNNRDMASDIPENCYDSTSTVDNGRIWVLPTSAENGKQSPKDTPIYQMGQALKNFVKDHFYHTRGVNMALIPYSGKASISPDRAAWTRAFPSFVDTSLNTELMIGACLYGTSGEKDAPLKQTAKTASRVSGDALRTTDTPYYWGDIISACPIMFRAGVQRTETKYGGNSYFTGMLSPGMDPGSNAAYRYLRMNLNPCYVGYANLLSMKCEKQCTYFLPNPYYMIEPTADLVKIYEMCNALYPIYDLYNVSNFIFIPLEWAYNMFQAWTRNTNCNAKDGSGRTSSGSDDGATLSRPSKTASGRKKAIILLVNKPDWFEPGEMTYLGFNNDFSEVPMAESDCIRGDINYKDTTLKFADGSAYTGMVAGAKKIIWFKSTDNAVQPKNGYYTSDGSCNCFLGFPKKYLIKIVVEPCSDPTWTDTSCNLNSVTGTGRYWYSMGHLGVGLVKGNNTQLIALWQKSKVASSYDGINFVDIGGGGYDGWHAGPTFGNNIWVITSASNRDNGIGRYPISGFPTTDYKSITLREARGNTLAFGGGNFMLISEANKHAYTSIDGATWVSRGEVSFSKSSCKLLGYHNGLWIAGGNEIYASRDNGDSWTLCDSSINDINSNNNWCGATYARGYFYAICANTNQIARSVDGKNWHQAPNQFGSHGCGAWNITLYNDKLYCLEEDGQMIHIGTFPTSSITFNGLKSDGIVVNEKEYTLTERQEFFIEADQINDTTYNDSTYNSVLGTNYHLYFTMKNLRLISAEITNRPYIKVTPTVTRNGNTFTANCRTKFFVLTTPTASDAKVEYTTPFGLSSLCAIPSPQMLEVSPETHRYTVSYDSDNVPSYSITLTPTNCSFGTICVNGNEYSAQKTGLAIDSSSGSDDNFSANGHTFSYTKASSSNSTGTATVSDGKIYCPLGTVLHVKAVPGTVQIFSDNGVTENVGTYSAAVSLCFSGAKNLKNYEHATASIWDWSTTGGVNFGHNFSTKKLKLKLNNAKIASATLKNQVIRWNAHFSYVSDAVNRKGYIANPYGIIDAWKYSRTGVYTDWLDPCLWHGCNNLDGGFTIHEERGNHQNGLVKCYDFHLYFKGIQRGTLITAKFGGNNGTSNSVHFGYKKSNGWYDGEGALIYEYQNNEWTINQFLNAQPATGDEIGIFFGRLKDSRGNAVKYDLNGAFFLNAEDKTYQGEITSANDLNLLLNKGVYTLKEGNYTWVCFCGDGDLYLNIVPLSSTIKFDCNNESNTTHELYNEYNFCIEPSQMTNNGDGQQYVSFTASNCNVTATYEYQNRMNLTLNAPSGTTLVHYSITGHKKEMVWNTCSAVAASASTLGLGQKIKFNGKRCYFGSVDGNIWYSDDFGKTWSALNNVRPINANDTSMLTIGPMGIYYVDKSDGIIYGSSDEGKTWSFIGNFNEKGAWYDAFVYSFNAEEASKALAVRGDSGNRGLVLASSDILNWTQKTNLNNSYYYYFGVSYHNKNWFVRNRNSTILYKSSDGGNSWSEISWNVPGESYMTYGSNLMMAFQGSGEVIWTCTDSDLTTFTQHSTSWPYSAGSGGICYANGNFVAYARGNEVHFAHATYHDGVILTNDQKTQVVSQDINQNVSISVDSTGSYTFYTSNMTITDIKADYFYSTTPSLQIEFKKLRPPVNTRYMDFSKNPFTCSNSRVTSNSKLTDYWEYDSSTGYYVNKSENGWYLYSYYSDVPGDFFGLSDSPEKTDVVMYMKRSDSSYATHSDGNRWSFQYQGCGLIRPFIDFNSDGYKFDSSGNRVYSDRFLYDLANLRARSTNAIMQGVTLPINAMLYAGFYDAAYHEGAWYKDQLGNASYDATEAVKNVTKAACAKLKSNWDSNIRLYLIKFRKQSQYKHKITGSATNFDYSYLDSCASGTAAPYVYDISSEDELKSALSAIAANIKSWAGYKEAKNVPME